MTLSHCMNAECFQTYYTKINRDQRFKINKLEQKLNERNKQGRFLQMFQLDCASKPNQSSEGRLPSWNKQLSRSTLTLSPSCTQLSHQAWCCFCLWKQLGLENFSFVLNLSLKFEINPLDYIRLDVWYVIFKTIKEDT